MHVDPDGPSSRERLSFQDFRFRTFPDGRCSAEVELEWADGRRFEAAHDGTQTLEGRLRCGAEATIEAASSAAEGRLRLELLGVKAVRAFDQWIVIVSVRGRSSERSYRLIGSCATAEGEMARGAALAVLDATNRIMEKYLG